MASLLEAYLPVALFTFIALTFPVVTYVLNRILSPRNPTPLKQTTYECGEQPIGEAQVSFHFQYFSFAIMFLVFDVAAVFILLWVLAFGDLSTPAQVGMLVFIGILFAATQYSLKKEEVIAL